MSGKRVASEMTEYDDGAAPVAKKFKAANVQIVASNEEIDDRISKLITSKKNSGGSTQVSEQLHADRLRVSASMDQAKTNAKIHAGQAEMGLANVKGNPDSEPEHVVHLTQHLPEGLPDLIEERLTSLERRVKTDKNLSSSNSQLLVRAVPRDIYARLKSLEERVVALEKRGLLSSKAAEANTARNESLPSAAAHIPASLPVEAVDDRIKELQQKLMAQSTHQ